MPSIGKNIEALSTKTVADMWDQIYMAQSPKFITFCDGATFKIRFIGDFVTASRHFIPSELSMEEVLTKEELEDIVKGNETTYNNVISKLFSKLDEKVRNVVSSVRLEDGRSITEAKGYLSKTPMSVEDAKCVKRIKEIDSIYAATNWTRCHLSNVMIREQTNARFNTKSGEIAILPITQQIFDGIMVSAKTLYGDKSHTMRLGGIIAHDIHIARSNVDNRRQNSNYLTHSYQRYAPQQSYQRYTWTVNLSPTPDSLTQPEISVILKYGVYDLFEAAKYINRATANKKSGFLYKVARSTMGNKEMLKEIFREQEGKDAEKHAELADSNLNDLPDTAFSNRQPQGAIGSLEL